MLFARRGRIVSTWGQSDPWGFFLRGPFREVEVASAVDEALRRLRAGERHLAVTHLCGTNIATTALLAGGGALLAVGRSRRDNWPRGLTGAIFGTMAGARAGMEAQKYLTTDADIGPLALQSVRARGADDGRTQIIRVTLRG